MDFRPVGFAFPYSCRFCSGLAADRVGGIVKGLRHTAGILRGHQVLHHVADGSAYCKFVFRDGEPLRSLVYHPALSQSKALFGSVHPREDAVVLEILIGIHNGGGAAQTNQQGSHIRRVVPVEELLAGFRFLAVLVFIVVYFILGLELNFSIVLAALASATAPASTVMTIRQTHAKGDFVETLLQVVALDDVVGLLAYSIAISVALASMTGTFQAGHIVKPIVLNIAVFLLGGLFGVFLKLLLHKRSTDNRLIVSVALLFAFCGICAVFDVSPLLGCMSMSIPVESWNDALSPWEAPAVWGKQGFGGNAADTLRFLTEQVIPTLKQQFELSENVKIILGGYSLAGLFSLWASTQTDLFHSIAAASPSVWFPGWMEFEQRHPIQTQHIYLSLGDKEEHTKNTVMAAVGDNIRTLHSRLAERGTDCTLEWNSGGHFKDADLRTAKAFRWTMEEHACSNGKTDIVHCSLCIHECGAKDLWQ